MRTIMDLRSLHRHALEVAGPVLAGVRPADLSRPSPCADWDLHTLLGHVIGHNHGFAEAVEAPDAPLRAFADRRPEPDGVAEAWQTSAERLERTFAAADLEASVLLVELSADFRFPVAAVVGFHLLDTVVHTWDVATALGQPFRPDDELVSATLAQSRLVPVGQAREQPGSPFAPALAGADDDWSLALALLGRRR